MEYKFKFLEVGYVTGAEKLTFCDETLFYLDGDNLYQIKNHKDFVEAMANDLVILQQSITK